MSRASLCLLALFALAGSASADWPQFRGGPTREGFTPEPLAPDLHLSWTYRPLHPPKPAWQGSDTRMPFDWAHHVVAANGLVYFGSTVDGRVYALDAATGSERWAFWTDGPVRFAPALWEGTLFVASDDGCLYCLDAASGELRWKRRGGPTGDLVLGNGRIVSRWPARGAPTVADGVVYFGAGVWPSEGIYVYALDAETGEVLWLNDTAGYLDMAQPHPGAFARSGISAQGYLAVGPDALLIPTGRATPAALDLDDGEFRYFHLQQYSRRGAGPFVAAVDDLTLNQTEVFRTSDGTLLGSGIPSSAMAAVPEGIVYASGTKLIAVSRAAPLTDGKPSAPVGSVDLGETLGSALIVAGDTAVVGLVGQSDRPKVATVELTSGRVLSRFEVDGRPLGFAADAGRLYVSTDKGVIHCFAPEAATPTAVTATTSDTEYPDNAIFADAAEAILAGSGADLGWCLDLGCGNGELAYEIAKRSNLRVCAVDSDPDAVAEARRRLLAAGLYGARVTVLLADLEDTKLPNYFANLVVSGKAVAEGTDATPLGEAERCLRPCGGLAALGRPGQETTWTRPALEGSGEWTHQYHDAANTDCSEDAILHGPLGMLWFADNDLEMPSRHGRGPAPLYSNGVMLVEGNDAVRALDAYNGTVLWEYALPGTLKAYDQEHLNGAAITGSNICVADGVLYVRRDDRCLLLDVATGAELGAFTAPAHPDGAKSLWGYIACEDGVLYGSLSNPGHTVKFAWQQADMTDMLSESDLLFAMDAKTGATLWRFEPEHSIRHNAIAVAAGRVYIIDRPLAQADAPEGKGKHDLGKLLALDARTGEPLWRVDEDVYGTMLAVSAPRDILLMTYQSTRFQLASEAGGRMTAFRASDGERLWEVEDAYESRPLINGDTVFAQPSAWNLLTGRKLEFAFARSYACGTVAASRNMMVFRSATLGYRDLAGDRGTENYGGIRPGCWINLLPVGGLLLSPETSNQCTCSYLNKASIALQPYGVRSPRITPKGGDSNAPVAVELKSEDPEAEIRYTLDGASPSAASPLYTGAVTIAESCTLTARAFKPGLPPSPTETASFRIEPDLIPLDDPSWWVSDAAGATPPKSDWRIVSGVAKEHSNHFAGAAAETSPTVERPGTLRVLEASAGCGDGTLLAELSSEDDDGIGLVFRVQDAERYYVWSMDRQRKFHVLAVKDGASYRVLAVNDSSYPANAWVSVRVELRGSRIAVYVNDELDLEARDATYNSGRFGLYAWGSAGAAFRRLKWFGA